MELLIENEISTNPKAATHTLRVDIVNKDATIKRIEINFCESDHWSESAKGCINIAELIGAYLYDMVGNDNCSVGRRSMLINKMTGQPERIKFLPQITKPEFIVNNTNF